MEKTLFISALLLTFFSLVLVIVANAHNLRGEANKGELDYGRRVGDQKNMSDD